MAHCIFVLAERLSNLKHAVQAILTHVVPMFEPLESLADGDTLPTLSGKTLRVTVGDGAVYLSAGAGARRRLLNTAAGALLLIGFRQLAGSSAARVVLLFCFAMQAAGHDELRDTATLHRHLPMQASCFGSLSGTMHFKPI